MALLALVVFFVTHTGRPLVWLPTGLLLGGAIGNLIDRAREGSVTDFVKLPHFPAFNVADMAITVGVLALLYVLEGPPRRQRPRPMPLELKVPAEAAGERLDVFLAAHAGSRAAAQRLIDAGHVTVDGAVRAKRLLLAGGELVRVQEPGAAAPAAAVPAARFAIAWEDEHLIVVDKPAGVVVHPARGHREGTLAQALGGRVAGGEDPARAGIVHRLDRDTSGLLVVARSEPVHAALKAQLAARELVREYLALVEGRPAARRGTIDAPLGPRPARADARLDRHGRAARGGHALRGRARAPARHAAARAARDGPHAPDPRAPAGDRPSGRRRPRVRRARAPRARAPVPARRAARVPRIP